MPTATLTFDLPEEQAEYDSARLGGEAMQTLWQIEHTCRSLLKYGTPTEAEAALATRIREMIPAELLDI
jgi:hypothetical protein